MPIFEVLLHGRNLKLLDQLGRQREAGVYVWRIVKSPNKALAVSIAIEALLRDPLFVAELSNDTLDDLMFSAEEIRERSLWARAKETSPIFYIEEDNSA